MEGIYRQIGQIIGYMRVKAGVSQRELCRGICSRNGLSQLENGDRGCEKIVYDALLQRAGVSADKFSCLMDWGEGRRLSLTEYALEMMRCRIYEEMGEIPRAANGYEQLLDYGERCQDEEDRVKFWPQVAWRLCGIYQAQVVIHRRRVYPM